METAFEYAAAKRNLMVYLPVYDVLNLRLDAVLLLLPAIQTAQVATIRWSASQLQLESPMVPRNEIR
jgi:hypothetical protein